MPISCQQVGGTVEAQLPPKSHVVAQQATHFWDLTDESASIRCCRISPNRLGSLATNEAGAAALLLGVSLCCAGRILPGAVGFARWSHHRVNKYLWLRPHDEVHRDE